MSIQGQVLTALDAQGTVGWAPGGGGGSGPWLPIIANGITNTNTGAVQISTRLALNAGDIRINGTALAVTARNPEGELQLNADTDVNVSAQNNINLTSALANINLICSGAAGDIVLTPGSPQGLVTINGKLRIPVIGDYTLISNPVNGFIAYDSGLEKFVGYENSVWVQFNTTALPPP